LSDFIRITGPAEPYYDAFQQLYAAAFKSGDRRDARQQALAFALPGYRLEVMREKGRVLLFASCYLFDDYFYLEHFAVDPALRGRGLGGLAMRALMARYPGKRLVLEVDPNPADGGERRIAFYQRLGLVMNPRGLERVSFVKNGEPVFLRIMSAGRALTDEEFARLEHDVRNVLGRDLWAD
jgi:ribosomal protein S18 acetylase RimI-like enzyme